MKSFTVQTRNTTSVPADSISVIPHFPLTNLCHTNSTPTPSGVARPVKRDLN